MLVYIGGNALTTASGGATTESQEVSVVEEESIILGTRGDTTRNQARSSKTDKIRCYPAPTDVSPVHQFLGLVSYSRRFVPKFAKIASPLHLLLKKDTAFDWTPECADAFAGLKEALIHAPVLAYPQFDSQYPFILETDASTKGLGAVLAQQQRDQKVYLIAFASHSLTAAETNYAIRDL